MRYLPDFRLPDKAIDLLDTACAQARFLTFSGGASPGKGSMRNWYRGALFSENNLQIIAVQNNSRRGAEPQGKYQRRPGTDKQGSIRQENSSLSEGHEIKAHHALRAWRSWRETSYTIFLMRLPWQAHPGAVGGVSFFQGDFRI